MEVTIKFKMPVQEKKKLNCLLFLIRSLYDEEAKITLVSDSVTKNKKIELPSIEKAVRYEKENEKSCKIIRDGKEIFISIPDCLRYCQSILRMFSDVQNVTEQYRILAENGIRSEALCKLTGIENQQMSTIASGSPYPYVITEWITTFKNQKLMKEEEEEKKREKDELKKLFGTEEPKKIDVSEEAEEKPVITEIKRKKRRKRGVDDGRNPKDEYDFSTVTSLSQLTEVIHQFGFTRYWLLKACNLNQLTASKIFEGKIDNIKNKTILKINSALEYKIPIKSHDHINDGESSTATQPEDEVEPIAETNDRDCPLGKVETLIEESVHSMHELCELLKIRRVPFKDFKTHTGICSACVDRISVNDIRKINAKMGWSISESTRIPVAKRESTKNCYWK